MGRQRLWPLNPPTKMTQAMMTNLMIMAMMTTRLMMIMRKCIDFCPTYLENQSVSVVKRKCIIFI